MVTQTIEGSSRSGPTQTISMAREILIFKKSSELAYSRTLITSYDV